MASLFVPADGPPVRNRETGADGLVLINSLSAYSH